MEALQPVSKASTVSNDVAESEFNRWCEAMDLDIDEKYMSEDDLESFQSQKRRIIRYMERGAVVINGEGEAVLKPVKADHLDEITFHERTGSTIMAADKRKKNDSAGKMYAMIAEMTGLAPAQITKLKGSDIKVAEAIFTLLMT